MDIAYAGIPAAVNWGSRGANVKVIAKVDAGKFGLLVRPGSGIEDPAALKGKKLGNVAKGSGVDLLVRGFLLPEANLTNQNTQLVEMQMPNMEQSIRSGSVDAAVAGEPFLTFAELRGLKVIKELPDPAIVVVARADFLKQHPDVVKKFMQGHVAAIQYLNQNQQATARILANAFQVPEIQDLSLCLILAMHQ